MSDRTKRGVSWNEENEANRILAEGRKGVTKHSLKKDYLSPSQIERRKSREVYPVQGFPEKAIVSGLFKRTYNPRKRSNKKPGTDAEGK